MITYSFSINYTNQKAYCGSEVCIIYATKNGKSVNAIEVFEKTIVYGGGIMLQPANVPFNFLNKYDGGEIEISRGEAVAFLSNINNETIFSHTFIPRF